MQLVQHVYPIVHLSPTTNRYNYSYPIPTASLGSSTGASTSSLVGHMSFQDCNQVVVHGHATNTVNGCQYNATVMHFGQKERRARTEYNEFEEVKRGQIFTLEKLHTTERGEREWELKDGELVGRSAQRTICTVQVHPDRQNKYTAVIYEGKDAHFFWKDDFRCFSCAGLGKPEVWQLYGLNRSKIPLLIFHGELVPLAKFYKYSFWGDIYLKMLTMYWDCYAWEIWLNMRGNLCKGLKGPHFSISYGSPIDIVVPSSADMLQEDTCFEFFQQSASSQLDEIILGHAYNHYRLAYIDDLFPKPTNHHPPSDHTHPHTMVEDYGEHLFRDQPHHLTLDMLDGLRFDTVYSPSRGAIASWPRGEAWKVYGHRGLVNETKVGDELVRFKLDHSWYVEVDIGYEWEDFHRSWFMQSSRIIDAHEMSGMEEEYFVVLPSSLRLSALNEKPSLTVENLPPIYLFIYPPPLSISELISRKKRYTRTHFWSLDENGLSEMSEEECRRCGVPELQILSTSYRAPARQWPTHIYTTLHNWQVTRSFDPTTVDWAQSLGYPELEIISGKKEEARFEGVRDYVSYLRRLREQDVELRIGAPVQVQETSNEAVSSSSWWSWEAIAGSGISACM